MSMVIHKQLNKLRKMAQPSFCVWSSLLALSIVQSFASALIINQSNLLGKCSTVCESRFCKVPPLLRYGKYCGVQYTGCPGQAPCDNLDYCCQIHDACIGNNLGNYLNKTCNHNLLECVEDYQASGQGQFQGNTCNITDVESSIEISMEIASHL